MRDVLMVLLPTIASFGAAWWGGKLGVQRDAEKLARARAFDRRLDWYERAIRALQCYQREHKQFMYSVAGADRAVIDKYYSSVTKSFVEAAASLHECILYGRPTTFSAILEFTIAINTAMRSQAEFEAAAKNVEDAASTVSVAIASEARDHMGLEPIPAKIPRKQTT